MLENNLQTPCLRARRRLFLQDDLLQEPCNDALVLAKKIEQKFFEQKREQWSYDFINDTPVSEGIWKWDIIQTTINVEE